MLWSLQREFQMRTHHTRAVIAATMVLMIASIGALAPSPAEAAVSVDALRARAIYHQTAHDDEALRLTTQALEAVSPAEGAIWSRLIPAWDDAYADLQINSAPPAGLPDRGHAFALLGLALNDDGSMKPDLISRLEVAKASLDAYPNSKIVVSGGVMKNGWTEAVRMRDWLQDKGIDPGRVILENRAGNTQENALRSLELMYADSGITSYTVISSASHIRRAWIDYYAASLKIARDLGLDRVIEPRSNVAFLDNTTSENVPSASEQTLISSNVASLFGVTSLYNALSTTPPPQPQLSLDLPAAQAGTTITVSASFTNSDLLAAASPTFLLEAPEGYAVHAAALPPAVVEERATATQSWTVDVPADARAGTTADFSARVSWSVNGGRATNELRAAASALISGRVSAPYRTASTTDSMVFAESADGFAIGGGGRDAYARADEYGAIFREDLLGSGQAVTTTVTGQSPTSPYARAGLTVRDDLSAAPSAGYATLAVTPSHGCVFAWDSDGDGRLDSNVESGGFAAPVQLRISRQGDTFTGSCSGDGRNWVDVGSAAIRSADKVVDAGLYYSAVNESTGKTGLARFTGLDVRAFERPAVPNAAVVSVGKPTTALSSETGRSPEYAVDGIRTNSSYWASSLSGGSTWLQVDLGSLHDLSTLNVRNYVSGGRTYTYALSGSNDGAVWFPLGGKSWAAAATDAGETFAVQARARYVRVTGLSNSANPSFHLSELSVAGVEAVTPELSVSGVRGVQGEPGAPVALSATLHNDGDVDATGAVVRFQEGDVILATSAGVNIPSRGTTTVTAVWSAAGRTGDVEVIAVADPDSMIDEINENDNRAAGVVTVVAPQGPQPSITTTGSVRAGDEVTVSFRGFGLDASGELWMNSDPVLLGSFATNAEGEATIGFRVPANTPPGDHTLRARIGGNEVASASITVTAAVMSPGTGQGPRAAESLATTGPASDVVAACSLALVLLLAGLGLRAGRRSHRLKDSWPHH